MKRFNDVVHYVHNVRENGAIVSKTSNALVISSTVNEGKEMLQLIYLDAAFDRPILSGADVQSALRTVFSAPHVESTFKGESARKDGPLLPPPAPAQGWKDVEIVEEAEISSAVAKLIPLDKPSILFVNADIVDAEAFHNMLLPGDDTECIVIPVKLLETGQTFDDAVKHEFGAMAKVDEEAPTLYVRPDATLAGLSGAPVEVKVVDPTAADLDAHAEEQKIAAETASPDGTSPSDSVAAKEELGGLGEEPPSPPQ